MPAQGFLGAGIGIGMMPPRKPGGSPYVCQTRQHGQEAGACSRRTKTRPRPSRRPQRRPSSARLATVADIGLR
jgi:hypothetical protein